MARNAAKGSIDRMAVISTLRFWKIKPRIISSKPMELNITLMMTKNKTPVLSLTTCLLLSSMALR